MEYASLILTFLLSLLLIIFHWKKNKNILFCIYSILILNSRVLLYVFQQEKSHEVFLAIFYIHNLPFTFLAGPALYFYTQSFLTGKFEFRPKLFIHVIPAFICLIAIYPYLFISMHEKIEYFRAINTKNSQIEFFENVTFLLPLKFLQVGATLLNYGYCIMTILYLLKINFNDGIKNKNRVHTLLKLIGLIMVLVILPFGFIIFKTLSNSNLNETSIINYQLIPLIKIPALFTLFLPFCLLLFPSWLYLIKSNSALSINDLTPLKANNQQNSELEKNFNLNEAEMLIDYLHLKKPYLKTEFSLHQITKDLDLPQAKVIDIFNSYLKMSFPKYRNKLRIDYALELIKNNEHLITTLHGISQKSGFKNKSTFNSAFKEYMNCTPSEWIEKNNH